MTRSHRDRFLCVAVAELVEHPSVVTLRLACNGICVTFLFCDESRNLLISSRGLLAMCVQFGSRRAPFSRATRLLARNIVAPPLPSAVSSAKNDQHIVPPRPLSARLPPLRLRHLSWPLLRFQARCLWRTPMLREPVLRTASEGAPVEREKKVRFKLTVRIRETPQASDVTGPLLCFLGCVARCTTGAHSPIGQRWKLAHRRALPGAVVLTMTKRQTPCEVTLISSRVQRRQTMLRRSTHPRESKSRSCTT